MFTDVSILRQFKCVIQNPSAPVLQGPVIEVVGKGQVACISEPNSDKPTRFCTRKGEEYIQAQKLFPPILETYKPAPPGLEPDSLLSMCSSPSDHTATNVFVRRWFQRVLCSKVHWSNNSYVHPGLLTNVNFRCNSFAG